MMIKTIKMLQHNDDSPLFCDGTVGEVSDEVYSDLGVDDDNDENYGIDDNEDKDAIQHDEDLPQFCRWHSWGSA